jgi:hypothetical protein
MRSSSEIRIELHDIKNNLPRVSDNTEDILKGWTEALEWVLSDYTGEVE